MLYVFASKEINRIPLLLSNLESTPDLGIGFIVIMNHFSGFRPSSRALLQNPRIT